MAKPWSLEERQILHTYYPVEGERVCKRLPGRTAAACITRAHSESLYVLHKDFTSWSPKEETVFRQFFPEEGLNVRARLPGKTIRSCFTKAYQLGYIQEMV